MGIVTDRKYVVRYIIYLCHLIILVVTLIFYSRGVDGISAGGKLILSANDKHRNQWKLKINILKGIIPR